ncbi:MAG: glucosylceramidase, partial [Oscillospiraceae bacterium]|nr:glucosylceramidase [Oscillospiraceae bacterium]
MKLNWTATTAVGGSWETTQGEALFQPDAEEVENQVVNLYPEIAFQTFEGFGGAITDAAGYVYSLMDEGQKRRVIQSYFAPDQMGYNRVRIHMDSCDFSTGMYEAMSDPDDRGLDSFSFARTEKYILPMLADAQKAAGKPLKLMLSPWSPPAFMKPNGQR